MVVAVEFRSRHNINCEENACYDNINLHLTKTKNKLEIYMYNDIVVGSYPLVHGKYTLLHKYNIV